MSNYSLITNTHVKEINAAASLEGAESFIGSGGVTSNTIQSSFNSIVQNDTVIIEHNSNTAGRLVQVYELQTVSGLYQLKDIDTYTVSHKSNTMTTVTKISSGTSNIKVNILLA